MRRIYLDNSATSFPKAPGVGDAMKHYVDDIGCNVNRGGYESSYRAEDTILNTREKLCKLFNYRTVENVIFTMNITQSLNFILKGLLKPGDHCIVSSIEHNAVMRPVTQLFMKGIEFSRVPCSSKGQLNPNDINSLIKQNTKAVIMTHASNVCGTILPIEDVGKICSERGIFFIVDSAQTAGTLKIDFEGFNIDALTFTGHKGLLGPQGIGGFIIGETLSKAIEPLISGGTGSLSDSEDVPMFLPDRFEPGTPNIPGIFGLNAALEYIENEGVDSIHQKEMYLTSLFIDHIKNIDGIETAGLNTIDCMVPVVSLNFAGKDNGEVAYKLDKEYGIATRCGLHCAPYAHKTLGTFPNGTVRFSFGYFNTKEEIDYTVDSINKILK